jgi:hypothetical protein
VNDFATPNLKETRMSSIANLNSVPSAVPPGILHLHGHKKGSHVGLTDDSSSDSTAQMPVGAAQNLFSRMLQSLEQVIGVQLTAATPAATAAIAAPAVTAATSAGASTVAGITASTTAAATSTAAGLTAAVQSKGTLLRNYLNNLSQNLPANGAQPVKLAGPSVSVNA